MKKILIIGIDSYIGSNLRKYLTTNNVDVYGTTNKKLKIKKKIYYLNLKKPKLNFLNINIDAAVICASITNLKKCETKPQESKIINVTNTIKLLKFLESKPIFTLYISSNLVFNGKKSFYSVLDRPNPISKYGKYKLLVEKFIKSKKYKNYSILRLTKVIGGNSKFIKYLESKINRKQIINYEKDYYLSPIKIEKVCEAISKLLIKKNKGIFQIGGKKEYNFESFIKSHFKKKRVLMKETNKNKTKWKNYHNSLKTYLPFKI